MYTAFYLSGKNEDLSSKVRYYSNKYCIRLIEIKDLREMLLKGAVFDKYALFLDVTDREVSSDLINYMVNQNGNPKLIGIILIGGADYNNNAIDNEKVFFVENNEIFAKSFVSVADRLRENKAISSISATQIEKFVYDFLIEINLVPKYTGFSYIKEAVIYCLAEGFNVDNLTTTIYPYIAKNHKTTTNNVERNIRIAIECSSKGKSIANFSKKPSNKELIVYILNILKQKINKIA